jgi:methyl-accepting chemotaxis protein
MSIKNRIIYSSILLLTLFLIMGIVNWLGNKSVMRKTDISYLLEKEIMHVQGIFRGINEFIIDEGEPLSIELTESHLAGFDKIHNTLLVMIEDPEMHEILTTTIDPQWKLVKDGSVSFMKNNPWISVDDDKAMLEYGQLTTESKKLYKDVDAFSEKTLLDAKATADKIQKTTTTVSIVIMMVMCFILLNLYRSITSPIKSLSSLAEGFSKGDLSMIMDDSRKDEFGILASFFNKATEKLNSMIGNIKELTVILSTNSHKLSDSASQIASNTSEQSGQTSQAASAIEQMNASFIDVAKNSAAVAESSQSANTHAMKGGQVVSETIEGMSKISHSVNESSSTVEALGKRSEQIGEIVKVINDIAGQTNLLALNAAIEAARAGEQGRGFAVVADEVRKLAERTTSATHEIGDMITGIQDDTTKAVESMHAGTKEVEAGVILANQAGEALQEIVSSVQGVSDMVQHIATAAEEQSTTGDVISANVESVANITQQTAESATLSSNAASELNELAQELRNLVSGFQLLHEDTEEKENIPDQEEAVDMSYIQEESY